MGNPDLSAPQPRGGPILLNRRAATRPTVTGVERWAGEVISRLPRHAPDRYAVVAPRPRLRTRGPAQAWEQLALPARAARQHAALIFSPANLAPVAWPRNVLVMHDAAVLREPRAYTPAYRMWHRELGLACARRALKIITVSEFSRRELIDVGGLAPDSLAVIPGGVSDRFSPRADSPRVVGKLGLSRPYVLTLATADQRKNLSALAATATRLAKRGIELVHAGDERPYFAPGPDTAHLRELGYVADGDLPGLYAGALAFVLPSRYEGFGLSCLEAMASGTPVVAADRAALPETCGEAALLVDPDDQRGIAEAVYACVTQPTLHRRLVTAGLDRARQFSWDRAAAGVHELLIELADGAAASWGSGPRPGTLTGLRPARRRAGEG